MQKNLKKILSAVLTLAMLLSLCAPVFSVSAAEELTKVTQWNLSLGDEIAANFCVSVSDSVSDDAVMVVTDGYGTHQYPLSAAEKDESGNYLFTARMAAAQLADTVTLQLQDGDAVGTAHTYSAVDYANSVLGGNYGESTKALVKAMLHYGAAAQTYFAYNIENLANAGIGAADAVEIPAVDTSNMVSGKVSGISFYGASLVFQSKVAVRFYFKVTGNIADYTFSTGTPVAKDGLYYIEVADINPQDYANTITLTVNDALTVRHRIKTRLYCMSFYGKGIVLPYKALPRKCLRSLKKCVKALCLKASKTNKNSLRATQAQISTDECYLVTVKGYTSIHRFDSLTANFIDLLAEQPLKSEKTGCNHSQIHKNLRLFKLQVILYSKTVFVSSGLLPCKYIFYATDGYTMSVTAYLT